MNGYHSRVIHIFLSHDLKQDHSTFLWHFRREFRKDEYNKANNAFCDLIDLNMIKSHQVTYRLNNNSVSYKVWEEKEGKSSIQIVKPHCTLMNNTCHRKPYIRNGKIMIRYKKSWYEIISYEVWDKDLNLVWFHTKHTVCEKCLGTGFLPFEQGKSCFCNCKKGKEAIQISNNFLSACVNLNSRKW